MKNEHENVKCFNNSIKYFLNLENSDMYFSCLPSAGQFWCWKPIFHKNSKESRHRAKFHFIDYIWQWDPSTFLVYNQEHSNYGRRKEFFPGGTKTGEICIFPLKTKRFFAKNFKFQGKPRSPPTPPSAAHDSNTAVR